MLISVSTLVLAFALNASVALGKSLDELWSMVGDVRPGLVNSTVEPTPIAESALSKPPNLPPWPNGSLPSDFIWGLGSAAYQCEGAIKADGRGPSVWDVALHQRKGLVQDNSDGDVAAEHYHRYKEDAHRLKALGVRYYSMSISWSRIFPLGRGEVNKVGLQHYIDEIDYLLSLGIEPIVTLLHYDIPHALQVEYGGFFSERIAPDFAAYAEVVFDALASKVKYWLTINEPYLYCLMIGKMFPRALDRSVFPLYNTSIEQAQQVCMHNNIIAHAEAVSIFRDKIQPKYPDRIISYKDPFYFVEPLSSSEADKVATNRSLETDWKWSAHPIYISGDYTDLMKASYGPLLPKFTEDQKKKIKGSADFFAWDAFCGHTIKAPDDFHACLTNKNHKLWPSCGQMMNILESGWSLGSIGDLSTPRTISTPDLIRRGLKFISDTYAPKHGILITEFGFPVNHEPESSSSKVRYDSVRANYFVDYTKAILESREKDKTNVIGAIAWAATDQFECMGGMRSRFGLQYVNFTNQERSYKKSAHVFSGLMKHLIAN